MHHHYYAGGISKPSPLPYPGDGPVDAPDDDKAATEIASRIHDANREGQASQAAENLMALATLAGRTEQLGDDLQEAAATLMALGDAVSALNDRLVVTEGQLQAIPQPDLAQQQELAQEVLTLEVRARNETQGGLAAIRAEREAAAAEYQQLGNLLSEQVSTAESWRSEMEARISTSTGEAALAVLRPMLGWWESIRPRLEGLRGITRITNPEPGVTEWTASPAVAGAAEPLVVRTKAARGERGYRGAAGPAGQMGGGGSSGSAGSKLIGTSVAVDLTASQEVELRHRALSGSPAVVLKGDVDLRARLISAADPDKWGSFTVSTAAARASAPTADSSFTVAPELQGPNGSPDFTIRVVRQADDTLALFVTAGENARWESTIAATTTT